MRIQLSICVTDMWWVSVPSKYIRKWSHRGSYDCSYLTQRGILHHRSKNLIIHPLPRRFGLTSHILYETDNSTVHRNRDALTQGKWEHIQFEPKVHDFEPENNASVHRVYRRHISSNSNRKMPQMLFIETAIFVDKDLFRHMAKNYPKNTEGNLIRFVLAMVNGVSCDSSSNSFQTFTSLAMCRFNCFIIIHHSDIKSISCWSA